jgi:hypothetical protein
LQHQRSKVLRWLCDTPFINGSDNSFTPGAIYQEPSDKFVSEGVCLCYVSFWRLVSQKYHSLQILN